MNIQSLEDNRENIEQVSAHFELVSLAKEFRENNNRLSELSMLTRGLTPEESEEKVRLVSRNHQIVIRQRQIMAQNGAVEIGGGSDEGGDL